MSSVELLPGAAAEPAELIASPWHTALVVLIEALNSYRGAVMAAHSRAGLGASRPVMYLRTMLFELLFLAVVAAGVRWHGTSLTTILGRNWRSVGEAMRDLGLGVGILLASIVVVSFWAGTSTERRRATSVFYCRETGWKWRCGSHYRVPRGSARRPFIADIFSGSLRA